MSGRDLLDALTRAVRLQRPPERPTLAARVRQPSAGAFADIRRNRRPVLLDGMLDDWPGRANLTLARLRERFGDRVVSGSPTRAGRLLSDPRNGLAFETVRLGDYVASLERGDWPEAYLHGPGDTWLPELNEDVQPPECCRAASWRVSRFWLSPPETSSPLHRHGAENIFYQVLGRKRFYLYPPAATPWLYSNGMGSALPNYSRFDADAPDYVRFPLSRLVEPLQVVLGAGDAIYIPSGWWHQVRSLDVSLSWNFFFADGVLALAQRGVELLKRMRGLEIYGLTQRPPQGSTPTAADGGGR